MCSPVRARATSIAIVKPLIVVEICKPSCVPSFRLKLLAEALFRTLFRALVDPREAVCKS